MKDEGPTEKCETPYEETPGGLAQFAPKSIRSGRLSPFSGAAGTTLLTKSQRAPDPHACQGA
jgi:hypothetical protein